MPPLAAPPRAPGYSRQQLQQAAVADAQKYGVGPWFVNQINQESGFNPQARSSAGAEGIAQFMPGTAKSVGLADPYNPIAALDAAARFDSQLLKKYGTPQRALSAYNSGRPDAYLDPSFAGGQTTNYVKSILGAPQATTLAAAASPARTPPPQAARALAAAAAQVAPRPDFRAEIANELAAAAGSANPDLRAAYATIGQERRAVAAQLQLNLVPPPVRGGARATGLAGDPQASTVPSGKAGGFLSAHASYKPGRIDQGHDFQTDPGAPILAPGDGVIVGVKSDPNGFGPAYPIVQFTTGPYAGKPPVYIGHTLTQLKAGQRVQAGQVISHTGTTPIGNAGVPGWAEIGYAPGGVPGSFGQHTPF